MKTRTIILACTVAAIAAPAWGAVSLEVTRPPVGGALNTGPLLDPDASQGQWFEIQGNRTHEFYDNVAGDGGGWAGHLAIEGYATNIVYAGGMPGTPILSFDILATITNDLGSQNGPWADGANSHGEFLSTPEHYVGTMVQTMLTADFALADLLRQPAVWTGPYNQIIPEIVAVNEDDTAWYCYNEIEDPQNPGGFYVPAWNFGDIPVNASNTRTLSFTVNGGLPFTDTRYLVIEDSELGNLDILSNRTSSLKISDWVDDLSIDPGISYPVPPQTSSDVSVFHLVPEPQTGIFALLSMSLLALRRRRRA